MSREYAPYSLHLHCILLACWSSLLALGVLATRKSKLKGLGNVGRDLVTNTTKFIIHARISVLVNAQSKYESELLPLTVVISHIVTKIILFFEATKVHHMMI